MRYYVLTTHASLYFIFTSFHDAYYTYSSMAFVFLHAVVVLD